MAQDLSFKEMKEIKDVYLAKKQGEALERITYPRQLHESLGLGYFGPETVVALSVLCSVEDVINQLTGLEDQILHVFTMHVATSSGSRSAKRMEKSLETIGQLGQYYPFQKGQIPTPTALQAPQKEKK